MSSEKSSGLPKQQVKLQRVAAQDLPPDVAKLYTDLEVASSQGGVKPPSGSFPPPVSTGEGQASAILPVGSATARGATSGGGTHSGAGTNAAESRLVGTERAGDPRQGYGGDLARVCGPGIRLHADSKSEPANGLTLEVNPAGAQMAVALSHSYGNRYKPAGNGHWTVEHGTVPVRPVEQTSFAVMDDAGMKDELDGAMVGHRPPLPPPPGVPVSLVPRFPGASSDSARTAIAHAELPHQARGIVSSQLARISQAVAQSVGPTPTVESPTKQQQSRMTMDQQYMVWMQHAAQLTEACKQRAMNATLMAATEAQEAHTARNAAQHAQNQVGQLTDALVQTQHEQLATEDKMRQQLHNTLAQANTTHDHMRQQLHNTMVQANTQVELIKGEANEAVQGTMSHAERVHAATIEAMMRELGDRERHVVQEVELEAERRHSEATERMETALRQQSEHFANQLAVAEAQKNQLLVEGRALHDEFRVLQRQCVSGTESAAHAAAAQLARKDEEMVVVRNHGGAFGLSGH